MANETVPAASDPSRSSTNFTFTCCAMHISVSVVPCCVTPDYADSSQHRQTRRLGSRLPNTGGTFELFPAAGPMRWHVPQTCALVHTLRVATRRQLGRALDHTACGTHSAWAKRDGGRVGRSCGWWAAVLVPGRRGVSAVRTVLGSPSGRRTLRGR